MNRRYLFDTGALIALERRKQRAREFVESRQKGLIAIATPMVCVIEWWRGRTDAREAMLRALTVEHLTLRIAQAAGLALASLQRPFDAAMSIDAAVAAHAALSDAILVTGDVDDFAELRAFFPRLRVLAV